ncbi:alkyl hydroperoxide reductase [Nitzschia inconspicua]|uniref:Alkyl hydroperoxide reductase n=1 Tax=Nitzschia inconspicua TaxID=303405 RepID=A0A9K3PY99_9STRA|nr:alkyl hydroperoxide reductase [Nitzschia inconspicua]
MGDTGGGEASAGFGSIQSDVGVLKKRSSICKVNDCIESIQIRDVGNFAEQDNWSDDPRDISFYLCGEQPLSSDATLQKARPWYMSDAEGSNLAADNALSMKDVFEGKLVAMFGVPAPFTGTCTNAHYPPYKAAAKEFKNAGVDTVICYSVSDPYAMNGWSRSLNNDSEDIQFLADEGGVWAKEFGVDKTYDAVSLGLRSIRFSMLVDNGEVKSYNVVDDAAKDADVLLEAVKAYKAG